MSRTAPLCVALGLAASCNGGGLVPPPTPAESLEAFLDAHPGRAPIHARVGAPVEERTCAPPPWQDVHPDAPGRDWPLFVHVAFDEEVARHPLVAAERPLFLLGPTEGLEREAAHVLMATTWRGTDITCGDVALEDALILVDVYGSPEPPPADVFAAAAARADESGLQPVGDLDVSVQDGSDQAP